MPVRPGKGGSFNMGESLNAAYLSKGGAKPGQGGNALISGHSNHAGSAIFNHLRDLKPGDLVKVTRGGETFDFVVDGKRYIKAAAMAHAVQSLQVIGGPSQVVLITCSKATYDYQHHHYRGWDVVTAHLATT